MKLTQRSAFAKHLKDAAPDHFAPIYFLIAKDSDERKESEQQMIRAFLCSDQPTKEEICSFDGEQVHIEQIIHEFQALTFFAKRRVILVQHVEKLTKTALHRLEHFCSKNEKTHNIFLILAASQMQRRTTFYAAIERVGVVVDFTEEPPQGHILTNKIVEAAKKMGKTIDLQTAKYLLQSVGQPLLDREVDKLICYLGDQKTITKADVDAICTKNHQETIWQLGEAIFSCQLEIALRIAHALLGEEALFFSLIRQIRAQFQTKCHLCAILANGGGPSDIQKHFPYMRGNLLHQHTQLAQRYGMKALQKGLLAIDNTERLAKSSTLSQKLLIEKLFFELRACSKSRCM